MGKPTREKKHFKKNFKHKNTDTEKKPEKKNVNAGRISKPQKSGKHKKIKAVDPFYMGQRGGDKKLQGANLKPKNDDQDSSRAERDFQKLKHMAKVVPKKKLKGWKNPFEKVPIEDRRGMQRKIPKVPKFNQGRKESENQFFRRMDNVAKAAIAKAKFEEHYDLQDDPPEKVNEEKEKTTKKNTQRLQAKKERKKEREKQRLEDRQTGFEKYKDIVKFGEVAMEPPRLASAPRKAPKDKQMAGGRSLLLNEIIRENTTSEHQTQKVRKIGQTTKRKFMSPARQMMMDAERNSAINLYREMKAKKILQKAQS